MTLHSFLNGEIRARALRETLKDAGLSVVVRTSELRARQTAEPLAEAPDSVSFNLSKPGD